jgi:hypothetical protein
MLLVKKSGSASLFAPGNDTEIIFNKAGLLGTDSGFTFDDSTKIFTLNGVQNIRYDQNGTTQLTVQNNTDGASAIARIRCLSKTSDIYMSAFEDSYNAFPELAGKGVIHIDGGDALVLATENLDPIEFYTGGFLADRKRMSINPIGFVDITGSIGIGGTVTVNGVQSIYIPDQTNYTGTMFLGNGGANIVSGQAIRNTIVGIDAGTALTEGAGNCLFGWDAGSSITIGDNNFCLGNQAGNSITIAQGNVLLGTNTGKSLTSGSTNIAIGLNALLDCITGGRNIGIGFSSLFNCLNSYNVAIGTNALYTGTTIDRCVALGNEAGYYETADDKLFIDNRQRANEADGRVKALIYGIFDDAVANQLVRMNANVETDSATGFYFGDQSTNGTWRIIRSGNDLVIERREAGAYVTKSTIAA